MYILNFGSSVTGLPWIRRHFNLKHPRMACNSTGKSGRSEFKGQSSNSTHYVVMITIDGVILYIKRL